MTKARPDGDDIAMKDGPCRRCLGNRTTPAGCFSREICPRCKGSGKERRMYVNGHLFPEDWERAKA